MGVHARLFLREFLCSFLGVLLALQAFLAVLAALQIVAGYPYLPADRVVAAIPLVLVHVLPLSVPIAVFAGGAVLARAVERQQGYLWIELAGGRPTLRQWPVVLVAALASAASLWFQDRILPAAEYRVRYGIDALAESPTSLALRLVHRPETLRTHVAGLEGADGTTMHHFSLVARQGPPTALTARRCEGRVTEDARHLVLDLYEGRYVRLDPEGPVQANLRFDRLSARLDLRNLSARPKQEIIDLRCYTGEELDRLEAQRLHLLARGWTLSASATNALGTVDTVRAFRLQAALMPLVAALLAVGFLGRRGGSRAVPLVCVTAAAVLFLFEESVLASPVYKRGSALSPVWAFLPTFQAAAALGLDRWLRRRARP